MICVDATNQCQINVKARMETGGRTDTTDCSTLPPNAVGLLITPHYTHCASYVGISKWNTQSTLWVRNKQDTKFLPITSLNVDRFSNFFVIIELRSKFQTNSCLNIPPCLEHVATLPCEIWTSENKRKSEKCIVINEVWHVALLQIYHSACWWKFFLNWWISGKFTDKMVDCFMRSFALHFSPQRCGTRNISVWRTETVTNNIVVMLTGRFNSLYGHQISNFCRPVLTCYQTDTIIDWPSVDHAQHFAATSFSLLKLLCTVCHAIFNMADMNIFLLGNELLLVSSDKYFKTYFEWRSLTRYFAALTPPAWRFFEHRYFTR